MYCRPAAQASEDFGSYRPEKHRRSRMLLSGEGVRDQMPAMERRRVVDAPTLRGIYDLNWQFLGSVLPLLHQRLPVTSLLTKLGPPGRALAAECPYSLFDLCFADAALWRSILAESRPAVAAPGAAGQFCRAAVFLSWHLVRSSELAAPLTLGMVPAVVDMWRAVPLAMIDHLAAVVAPFLAPRWAGHPTFWPLLAAAAAAGNHEELARVRLLGLQLLAADSLQGRATAGASERRGK
jgi:hypothetical protein